ncbi:MAG: hypothetical protein ACKOOK_02635, partial [Actinomycetota bacterium]
MRRFLAVALLALLIPLIPALAANPPKSGALCSKSGLTQNYQGKKFTCIKSGKKLVWDKGTPLPTSSKSPVT